MNISSGAGVYSVLSSASCPHCGDPLYRRHLCGSPKIDSVQCLALSVVILVLSFVHSCPFVRCACACAGPGTPRRASFHIGNLREPPVRPPARPSEVRVPCPFTRPVRQVMVVEVVDTGPGVSAQARKRLFTQFCQGAEDEISKPRPCSGTGLGLSICARQVRVLCRPVLCFC
jgi:hypothetical protein